MTLIQEIANLLSCETDTIVTIFITVAIFISGILVNLCNTRIRKSIDRRNYRNFVQELITNIRIYTKKQSKEFEKFHKTLRIDNHQPFVIKRKSESSLSTFNKIPIEKIYDSFLGGIFCNNKKRRKGLRFILNNTLLIENIDSELPQDIDKMLSKFSQYENSWDKSIDEIRKIYDSLRQQYISQSLNPNYLPLFKDMNEILSEWKISENATNRTYVKEKIIDVLPHKIIQKYNGLDLVILFQNSTIEAKLAYDNMENTISIYANMFSDYQRIFNNYDRKMKIATRIISVRNFCR